jgi:hypothetical protein
MSIMATGLKPGLGAGSDELNAFYGHPVPGVYVAQTFSLALTYPGHPTTSWEPSRGCVNGGVVPSLQHSVPLRMVLRVVAKQASQLWSKKDQKKKWNTQFQFMPKDLHITHAYFVGVGYGLVPKEHPHVGMETFGSDLASDKQIEELMRHPDFIPTVPGWQYC